ncbi:uncharacterized protein TNCV_4795791 [Trichonephila clavipes]|nr:uncharacterized protein TNCV_4795791 [Trichonephila clavipes]
MPQQLIDTLILSMGRRCEACLAKSGEIISPTKDRMFLAGHPSQGCFGLQSHCTPCYFLNQAYFTPVAAVAEWYGYRTVACFVTGSSPVPLKTRRVRQRCTLNLSRAETSSRWCCVVVRRGGASSGVVHVT